MLQSPGACPDCVPASLPPFFLLLLPPPCFIYQREKQGRERKEWENECVARGRGRSEEESVWRGREERVGERVCGDGDRKAKRASETVPQQGQVLVDQLRPHTLG